MKIIRSIFSGIAWTICLGLRCTAWSANRLQMWIKSGPSPRLWVASDEDLIQELRRRGVKLSIKQAKLIKVLKATQPTSTRTATASVSDYSDIELAIANLQDVSRQRAREAVVKAVREITLSGECANNNVILAKAVKYT